MDIKYLVDQREFYNPFLAWENAKATNTEAELFLSTVFELFDWTKEPEDSVKILENKTVEALVRRKTPLRVCFSAGTDSLSITHALCRNGVKAKYTIFDGTLGSEKSFNHSKWTDYKIELLNQIHQYYTLDNPEVEVITSSKEEIEKLFSDPLFYVQTAYYRTTGSFSFSVTGETLKLSKFDPKEHINIVGMEKPYVHIDGRGIYWDMSDSMVMPAYSYEYPMYWFYLNDDVPELISKQCWNVINYCRKNWPKLRLEESLDLLQATKAQYHQYCLVLERTTNAWTSSMSLLDKPITSNPRFDSNEKFPFISQYYHSDNKAWNNYINFFKKYKELTGSESLLPIKSNRFYLEEHYS